MCLFTIFYHSACFQALYNSIQRTSLLKILIVNSTGKMPQNIVLADLRTVFQVFITKYKVNFVSLQM